uniref:Uncharacterized protein n=1 Tax=Strigamia maritima TaxID=126957 RepID=T1JM47_STRMM
MTHDVSHGLDDRISKSNLTNGLKFMAISSIAFHELNPFPMRFIKSKRSQHAQAVKTELDAVTN